MTARSPAPSPGPANGAALARALDPLRTSRVALLTTYRRDGRGVDTPVGIQVGGDQAFFTTRPVVAADDPA